MLLRYLFIDAQFLVHTRRTYIYFYGTKIGIVNGLTQWYRVRLMMCHDIWALKS